MKICPTCGESFDGAEVFCPHDGSRLVEMADASGALAGETLRGGVTLDRLLYADPLGERYAGTLADGSAVRVTLLNRALTPPLERFGALGATKALLDAPLPAQLAEAMRWDITEAPFYLLERDVIGPSLRELLQARGQLDWRLAVRISCHLARICEWMDEQGVVPRALHPGALELLDLQSGQLRLAEWALGVLSYQPHPLEAARQGEAVPYASYTAPELIEDASVADRRSVLYNIGLLLYEMITGKAGFDGDQAEEILKRQRREKLPRLRIATGDASLPEALDDMIEVLLDKSPERRFQAPGALINAMSTLVDGLNSAQIPALTRPQAAPQAMPPEVAPAPAPEATPEVTPAPAPEPEPAPEREDEDHGPKKTLLFISAEEVKAAQQAQADAKPAVEEATGPTTVMLDNAALLEQDRQRKAQTADAAEARPDEPIEEAKRATVVIAKDFSQEATEPEAAPSRSISGASATTAEPEPSDSISMTEKLMRQQADAEADAVDAATRDTGKKKKKKKKRASDSEPPKASPDATVTAEVKPVTPAAQAPEPAPEAVAPAPAAEVAPEPEPPASKVELDATLSEAAPVEVKPARQEDTHVEVKPTPAPQPPKADAAQAAPVSEPGAELDDDQWFGASTEQAWEQDYLREHRDRQERKWRNRMLGVVIALILTIIGFVIYFQFFAPARDAEDARLGDDTPPEVMLARATAPSGQA